MRLTPGTTRDPWVQFTHDDDAVVDRRADIWAFGCVLYEMLAGKTAAR